MAQKSTASMVRYSSMWINLAREGFGIFGKAWTMGDSASGGDLHMRVC